MIEWSGYPRGRLLGLGELDPSNVCGIEVASVNGQLHFAGLVGDRGDKSANAFVLAVEGDDLAQIALDGAIHLALEEVLKVLVHGTHLIQGGEIGHLGYELGVLHRLHGILILELGCEELQEVVHLKLGLLGRKFPLGRQGAGGRRGGYCVSNHDSGGLGRLLFWLLKF